jgi:hypothetical protein
MRYLVYLHANIGSQLLGHRHFRGHSRRRICHFLYVCGIALFIGFGLPIPFAAIRPIVGQDPPSNSIDQQHQFESAIESAVANWFSHLSMNCTLCTTEWTRRVASSGEIVLDERRFVGRAIVDKGLGHVVVDFAPEFIDEVPLRIAPFEWFVSPRVHLIYTPAMRHQDSVMRGAKLEIGYPFWENSTNKLYLKYFPMPLFHVCGMAGGLIRTGIVRSETTYQLFQNIRAFESMGYSVNQEYVAKSGKIAFSRSLYQANLEIVKEVFLFEQVGNHILLTSYEYTEPTTLLTSHWQISDFVRVGEHAVPTSMRWIEERSQDQWGSVTYLSNLSTKQNQRGDFVLRLPPKISFNGKFRDLLSARKIDFRDDSLRSSLLEFSAPDKSAASGVDSNISQSPEESTYSKVSLAGWVAVLFGVLLVVAGGWLFAVGRSNRYV